MTNAGLPPLSNKCWPGRACEQALSDARDRWSPARRTRVLAVPHVAEFRLGDILELYGGYTQAVSPRRACGDLYRLLLPGASLEIASASDQARFRGLARRLASDWLYRHRRPRQAWRSCASLFGRAPREACS